MLMGERMGETSGKKLAQLKGGCTEELLVRYKSGKIIRCSGPNRLGTVSRMEGTGSRTGDPLVGWRKSLQVITGDQGVDDAGD